MYFHARIILVNRKENTDSYIDLSIKEYHNIVVKSLTISAQIHCWTDMTDGSGAFNAVNNKKCVITLQCTTKN